MCRTIEREGKNTWQEIPQANATIILFESYRGLLSFTHVDEVWRSRRCRTSVLADEASRDVDQWSDDEWVQSQR